MRNVQVNLRAIDPSPTDGLIGQDVRRVAKLCQMLLATLAAFELLALARMVTFTASGAPGLGLADVSGMTTTKAQRAVLLLAELSGVSWVPLTEVTELKETALGGMAVLSTVGASLQLEANVDQVTKALAVVTLRNLTNLICDPSGEQCLQVTLGQVVGM